MAHDPCIFGDSSYAFDFKRIFYVSEWQKELIMHDIGNYNSSYYVKTANGINATNYQNIDFNKKENCIEIYDTLNLNLVLRSSRFQNIFVDFCFCKDMENVLIMVRNNEDENKKEKNMKKNYKILMLNT